MAWPTVGEGDLVLVFEIIDFGVMEIWSVLKSLVGEKRIEGGLIFLKSLVVIVFLGSNFSVGSSM